MGTDERRHPAGPDRWWGEAWSFAFATPDASLGGYVRLALHPNGGVAWWWAAVAGVGRPSVLVRDHEVPLPAGEVLEIRTDGLWGELTCDAPDEQWSVGMEAFGVALGSPGDAYRGERGERTPVAFDLEWGAVAPVHRIADDAASSGYEQACSVVGIVQLADESIAVDGWGERSHRWGIDRRLVPGAASAAAGLDDGTLFHAWCDPSGAVSGYVVAPVGEPRPVATFVPTASVDADGIPTSAVVQLDGRRLDVEVVGAAPLLLEAPDGTRLRHPRCLCRFRSPGGATGVGWTALVQPG